MKWRPNRGNGFSEDPPHVYTSPSGRKYIKPNEIVRLDEFKRQMDRLRAIVMDSRLVE